MARAFTCLHTFHGTPIFYQDFYRSRRSKPPLHTGNLTEPGIQALPFAPSGSLFQAGHTGSIPVIRSLQLRVFFRNIQRLSYENQL